MSSCGIYVFSCGLCVGRAAKLQHMTGESEAQRITVFVKKMVYDEDGVEGRSRAHFLATFNPAQVRASGLDGRSGWKKRATVGGVLMTCLPFFKAPWVWHGHSFLVVCWTGVGAAASVHGRVPLPHHGDPEGRAAAPRHPDTHRRRLCRVGQHCPPHLIETIYLERKTSIAHTSVYTSLH